MEGTAIESNLAWLSLKIEVPEKSTVIKAKKKKPS